MDEQQKQIVTIAILAFNITVIAVMISLTWYSVFGSPDDPYSGYGLRAVVSIVAGAVVAGIAFAIAKMTQK